MEKDSLPFGGRGERRFVRARAFVVGLARALRWYFARAYSTLVVACLVAGVYVVFRALVESGDVDAINMGLILQSDWARRGGWQWMALLANGFVTFSLGGLAGTLLLVVACLPWLEKRLGSAGALALVVGLAWALGPIKIAWGAPGAVGVSKFTLMVQTFWWADNPLLLWLAGRLREHGQRTGREGLAPLWGRVVRHTGWVPALWLASGPLMDGNAAHILSVAAGATAAAFCVWRRPPWSPVQPARQKGGAEPPGESH